jgi:NAD+ kinase
MHPKLSAIVVAPISPHTLVSRPIIFDQQDVLEAELGQPRKEALLTVDGQVSVKFKAGERLEIRKAPHTISLVRIEEKSFYEVLRTKLHWGVMPGENQK